MNDVAVTSATQESNEDEVVFNKRAQEAAGVFHDVFISVEMVQCYMRELHEAVRVCVREDIMYFPLHARAEIIIVRAKKKAIGSSKQSLNSALVPKKAAKGAQKQVTRAYTICGQMGCGIYIPCGL